MKKQEIEKKLNQTISSIVPDVLENILTRCEEREGLRNMNFIKEKEDTKELVENKKEKKKFFTPKLVGAFATCFICLFGILGFSFYQTSVNSVDSIIDFDVNPSIEIKTNRNEEIIDAIALNDEGKLILEDMDLEKVDLDVGVNAIIDALNNIHFEIPSWVPIIGGNTWGFNLSKLSEISLPRLAMGGVVDQPTLAMVGEAGAEAVMPLENNTGWIDILADKLSARMPRGNDMNSAQLDMIIELLRELLEKSGDVYLMDEIVGIVGEAWDQAKRRRGNFAFSDLNR